MTDTNMKLWDSLKGLDRKYLKKITGKSYSGDSPNPTWIIQKLTEQLGPIGVSWGFNVVNESINQGRPHVIKTSADAGEIIREEFHQVEIEFWQVTDGERRSFSSFGGTKMLYLSNKGAWICDEDAAKKSLTDAYVKAASWLGCAGDLFLGLYDDRYGKMPGENDKQVDAQRTNTSDW